jgi:hypothetical protein
MLLLKVKKEVIKNKPRPHPLSAVAVEITSPRKVKSAGGGDCEQHGAKTLRFFSNNVQEYTF